MYSLFTKSYFERCHNYDDPHCAYTIEDQEIACKKYMEEKPKQNEYPNHIKIKRQLYYYGIHNNQLYDFVVESDGNTYELNKHNTQYQTKGLYIIEDLIYPDDDISPDVSLHGDISSCNFKFYNYVNEPQDFHRRMMLYLLKYENNTIFCPYWEIKPFS